MLWFKAMSHFNPGRYLFVKTFIWFWVIVLLVLVLTVLATPLNFTQIYSSPLTGTERVNFIRYSQTLERVLSRNPESIEQNADQPRLIRNKYIYLFHEDPAKSKLNRELPSHIDLITLAEFLNDEPQQLFSSHYFALGPAKITVGDDNFWLFEIKPEREANTIVKFSIVPFWLKVFIAIGSSAILTWLFTRRLVNPILSLRDCADQIARGKFDVRHVDHTRRVDEIGQLSTEFNNMASRLEAMVTSQKRLFRDISHELRSPLTRLNTANVIAQDVASQEVRPLLHRIENESGKLEQMISELMMISRLESEQQQLSIESININQLLEPLLADAKFFASSCGKTLMVSGEQNLVTEVDPALFSRAIDNLLRNAIKYANQEVVLVVRICDGALQIQVKDDGEGVAEAELDKIAEPFYRVAASRNRDEGGNGIGLAIVKSAVKAHRGTLRFNNEPGGGFMANITLPK